MGCHITLRRERSLALHPRNDEQQQLQEELASPTAGHNLASRQIFTREQIYLALLSHGLGQSCTLQDTLESITRDQSKDQHGPYLPGKVQHLYQLPYASLQSQEQSQGITVAACRNRYLTSATSSIDVQSTGHYVTLNNTSLEDTNSAFILTPGWTRGSWSVPRALESSRRHWRSSTCNHADQQQNPGLPSHPKAYPQLNHVWPEPLEISMAHRGGTVPPSRLWTRDLSKRKKGVFSFCVSAFLQ